MRRITFLNIFLLLSVGFLFSGCLNTEGTLEISGKVIDESTKIQIPRRDVIVQGLIQSNDKLIPIDAGQFSTDSSGRFTYKLRKVKDAYYYNFCIVGDSNYAFKIRELGLLELQQNAKYLSFSMSKLVDFTIKIFRKSKTPLYDTLYLSWLSDNIDGRAIYPCKIDNYEKTDHFFGPSSDLEFEWIGGNVNSTIKTKAFADKMTRVNWRLVRNKKRREFIDTITCKRDLANIVYFIY